MGRTFAEKFEDALDERKQETKGWGLRTLARKLADNDPERTEIIRRRLNKYRPKPGGGAAETAPTDPTRHEIEKAMGLKRDSLKPDADAIAASMLDREFLADLAPLRRLYEIGQQIERGELHVTARKVGTP